MRLTILPVTNLTLLIIGFVWPEPDSSAAGRRMLQLINACQRAGWKIVFSSPAQPSEHMVDLKAMGIECQPIALNCASFDRFIEQLQPSIVMFDRFMIEEQFSWRVAQYCPSALRVLDTEDLQFLRHARHNAFKQNRTVTLEDYQSDMALREVAAIYRSDLSLMISEAEIDLLVQQLNVPADLLLYCPFMLPAVENKAPLANFDQRKHFISIGNFRHAPNWDAVLWLKQTIWPLIRKQLPTAELHVYGAYPPPKATALHDTKSGFLVKGWVDDAYAVMQSAKVCLAPLRFGAGIKGKLSDAMQCGTPSVTTDVGSEGMTGGLPWGGVVVNNAEQFAEAAVELYQDADKWQQSQQQGFAILQTCFDERKFSQLFIEGVLARYQQREQYRLANFTGAMLRHHSHKSTAYMSQWIAAKNQHKTE